MSHGLRLFDSTGFRYYDSTVSSEDEFILVLDSFEVYSENSGQRTFNDVHGGNVNNIEWSVTPKNPSVRMPNVWREGNTLKWSPGTYGSAGSLYFMVTIK